jgi:hypothetical protein
MKEPSEAKGHLGQSLRLPSPHRPSPKKRLSSCAAARSAHTGTQIGPHRATSRPDRRKETTPAITSRQSPANGQHTFDRPIRLGSFAERAKPRPFAVIADRTNGRQPRRRLPVPSGGQLFWQTQVPATPLKKPLRRLRTQKPRVARRAGAVRLRRRPKSSPLFSRIQKGVEQWKKLRKELLPSIYDYPFVAQYPANTASVASVFFLAFDDVLVNPPRS